MRAPGAAPGAATGAGAGASRDGDAAILALDLGGTQIRSPSWISAARSSGRPGGPRSSRAGRDRPGLHRPGRGGTARHQAGPPRCPSRPSASPLPAAGSPAGGSSIPRTSAAASRHALAGLVGEALGLPAFLDRDTQVAALAAGRFGAAAGCADFLYLTIPPSGGRRADGRLLRGPRDGRRSATWSSTAWGTVCLRDARPLEGIASAAASPGPPGVPPPGARACRWRS